jgi:cephalosporin hydroxylase
MDDEDLKTIRAFNKLWHESINGTWHKMRWLGRKALKTPCDLWMYQELITKIKPDWIIECGTCFGGSALFMATICEAIGKGKILAIDIKTPKQPFKHPRIQMLEGSSVDGATLKQVKKIVSGTVIVILDSNHKKNHVLKELHLYSPFVTRGSYLIVEDTDINRYVRFDHGPGPYEAVEEFLKVNSRFQIDKDCEQYYLTFNPDGYLKCVR